MAKWRICLITILGLTFPVAAADRPAQTLQPAGTTVLFAQVLDWLDDRHFAVGRWDGSITLFRTPHQGEFGPIITQALSEPTGASVEMLVRFDKSTFVTSDGRSALAVWRRAGTVESGSGFTLAESPSYDGSLGPANSGLAVTISNTRYLVTGHENGSIALWVKGSGGFTIAKVISLKSPDAPANPWGLRNIRCLAVWRSDVLITGSEDGDLVGLHLPDLKEVFRVRYNKAAQRGINSISVVDNWLLVANCAVGSADKNLWLFDLKSGRPELSDAEDLALDTFRSQVFDFDADLAKEDSKILFFSSTEEGLIWMGDIESGQLIITGVTKSSPEGGSIMAVSPSGDLLAAATYALRLFRLR
ncbi:MULTISPECIES: WD40 repeat domain-containing protein [unclassified Mesorhizobium]|uniref:WD40 repeat domain-containing protein n=1 Tax=unclassified Mesorhizobium TaxID=325217 RepID=UPI0011296038|nr:MULTISPECIES: WD40 repeat domain-containing protein [unclassified Mesorhizobium]TPK95304.1 WD40 repeat domain-containing protein [Mesorhizobium sp. B2-4-16]TPL60999.1 WD40 repeat domain-containing protein [Mesorhizobium sp. B2-4-3]